MSDCPPGCACQCALYGENSPHRCPKSFNDAEGNRGYCALGNGHHGEHFGVFSRIVLKGAST